MQALSALKEAPEADHHVRIGLINNEMMTEGIKASHSKDVTMVITGCIILVIALCRPSVL